MMIGPETYYEENLKGKTAEQIMTAIRSLKREINRLKNVMEYPKYQCTKTRDFKRICEKIKENRRFD